MESLIKLIQQRIAVLEPKEAHNQKMIEEDFNPDSWSGGNFDECYQMGVDDGNVSGELHALYRVLGELQKLKGMM